MARLFNGARAPIAGGIIRCRCAAAPKRSAAGRRNFEPFSLSQTAWVGTSPGAANGAARRHAICPQKRPGHRLQYLDRSGARNIHPAVRNAWPEQQAKRSRPTPSIGTRLRVPRLALRHTRTSAKLGPTSHRPRRRNRSRRAALLTAGPRSTAIAIASPHSIVRQLSANPMGCALSPSRPVRSPATPSANASLDH